MTNLHGVADASEHELETMSPPLGASIREYLLMGWLFTYILIECLTFVYQLDGLGITLWSPSAGLSVIFLLLAGTRFAPFVFLASLITDYVVYTGPRGVFVSAGTSLVEAGGLTGLALALAPRSRTRKISLSQVLTTLGIVAGSIFLTGVVYCPVLSESGLLATERLFVALRNFWIGNTLGIVTLLPMALTALNSREGPRVPARKCVVNGLAFGVLSQVVRMALDLRPRSDAMP